MHSLQPLAWQHPSHGSADSGMALLPRCADQCNEFTVLALQASIAGGELGILRTSPDAPGLTLLSELLNGFGGSLFDGIRSRQVCCPPLCGAWLPAAPLS